eukprot:GEMP01036050.1.p1 GENE.GEMP01036050.1~~GEMP01036050.1.p1  ORF type:complete len:389 (+),score=62.37 GEMP01036050.1:45-1169(+)
MAKSASRERSRDRRRWERDRERERERERTRRSHSKHSRHSRHSRRRSRSRGRRRERSRSERRRDRSRSRSRRRSWSRDRRERDRIPPGEFVDYEALNDGSGWYVYRKTGKWKYHKEVGVFLHVKSGVYYSAVDSAAFVADAKYRRLEGEDDPLMKKLKQWQDMQHAISKTEFVQFEAPKEVPPVIDEEALKATRENSQKNTAEKPIESQPVLSEPEKKEEPKDKRLEGKVQKWDTDRGFGFILPLNSKIVTSRDDGEKGGSLFVHRRNIVGSTTLRPLNLKEGVKVTYDIGEMDGRPCATEVRMLGKDGAINTIHEDNLKMEDKRKKFFVSMESLQLRSFCESWPGKRNTLQDRFANEKVLKPTYNNIPSPCTR